MAGGGVGVASRARTGGGGVISRVRASGARRRCPGTRRRQVRRRHRGHRPRTGLAEGHGRGRRAPPAARSGAVGTRIGGRQRSQSAAWSERARRPGIGTPAAGRPIIVRPTGGAAGRGGRLGVGMGGPAERADWQGAWSPGRHGAGAHAGDERGSHRRHTWRTADRGRRRRAGAGYGGHRGSAGDDRQRRSWAGRIDADLAVVVLHRRRGHRGSGRARRRRRRRGRLRRGGTGGGVDLLQERRGVPGLEQVPVRPGARPARLVVGLLRRGEDVDRDPTQGRHRRAPARRGRTRSGPASPRRQ